MQFKNKDWYICVLTKSTLKKILPFFSYFFHPIFIPLLGTFFYVLLESHRYSLAQYLILFLQIILFAVLVEKSITFALFPNLYFFFVGGMFSTILAFFLLYTKIKASIHMIGISSLTIYIVGLSIHNEVNTVNTVAFFVIMNGFVASSRLVMKAHSNNELVIGLLCGVIPQSILLYFWL